jgi:hypothetical protein
MAIPLDQWNGSAATKELHATIVALSEATSKQTKAMIGLTWAIVVLTFLMLVGVGAQIAIAMAQFNSLPTS